MPYEIGARVKLTRDVQVTTDGAAVRTGHPGPLFLAEGLAGIVTGSAKEAGGAQDHLASFEQAIRGSQFDGFTTHLIEDLRQRVIRQGGSGTGVGAQVRYRVRFENGFVLDGLDGDWLTEA
ncbi:MULTISPECIES: hypothetical protein [unclassified Kitasatospora]|uniref:hypothetical protein n=1 Tax=unclassified Kitasatospora TaxID=2633591 RepID=UPI00070C4E77|nr:MULTISPECIES: hypothetical protein [unclassified Kitasatospora]KQV15681.1 hypothetical protein ASC99_29685 [Kitasatospora sp. Root107]